MKYGKRSHGSSVTVQVIYIKAVCLNVFLLYPCALIKLSNLSLKHRFIVYICYLNGKMFTDKGNDP